MQSRLEIKVTRNRFASESNVSWFWSVITSRSITTPNATGFSNSPMEAFKAAYAAAEREGLIAHNPNDNEDCFCSMCQGIDL